MPFTSKGFKPENIRKPKAQKFSATQRDKDSLILLPEYEKYLVRNPDVYIGGSTFKKVLGMLTKKPRDRSRSFSASSAGYCMRRQELAFLGMPKAPLTDPKLIRIFNNGTFGHLRWQIGFLDAHLVEGIEVTVKTGLNRATMDGLGTAREGRYRGEQFIWEHKTRMSFSWLSQERSGTPDPKTRRQVAMQMFLTGYDLASVTNENKDTQEVSEFVIERDDAEIAEAKEELRELNRAVDMKRLHPMLPECVKQNRTGEFWSCPYGGQGGACIHAGSWPK